MPQGSIAHNRSTTHRDSPVDNDEAAAGVPAHPGTHVIGRRRGGLLGVRTIGRCRTCMTANPSRLPP